MVPVLEGSAKVGVVSGKELAFAGFQVLGPIHSGADHFLQLH